jgi:HlyD family secretion protein
MILVTRKNKKKLPTPVLLRYQAAVLRSKQTKAQRNSLLVIGYTGRLDYYLEDWPHERRAWNMDPETKTTDSRFAARGVLIRRTIKILVALGLFGGAVGWYSWHAETPPASFRTTQVMRGDLLVSIDATGTVEPEDVIDVGAQVAGELLAFGKDANGEVVDYGSPVEAGTVLVRIDDSLYAADVAAAEAQIQSAQAGQKRAEAELEQMRAKLNQAECDWIRAQQIGPSEALAQASYDAYKGAYEAALANVKVCEAQILQAKASLTQAAAVFQKSKRKLDYCTIKSPVKGVIIDRRVNNGQTVVASLNAPSLFLLAKDLRRIEVWVAVNEADIGKINPGQPVTFTVDAFPGETFEGTVGKIRLNASMTQNVVTYTVEVITDNSSGRLLPYLTANVQFELDRRSDVLLVPKTALSWTPSIEMILPELREMFENPSSQKEAHAGQRSFRSGRGVRPPSGQADDSASERGRGPSSEQDVAVENRGMVWVLEGQHVKPVRVWVGLTDNVVTEVEGSGLTEGMVIVTGVQMQAQIQTDQSNPFAPKRTGRGRGGR